MSTSTSTGEVVQLRPSTGHSALAIAADQDYWTERQVAALRHLGAEAAGEGDLAVFFHQATRTGLDPFARQIYLIGRDENRRGQDGNWTTTTKYTIQTGIDGFRLIARRAADAAREHLSYEDTLWCGPDEVWRKAWVADAPPAAAMVTVLRDGDRFPAVALFREYAQTKRNGDLTGMWARMPASQLAKCAEALALRRAFPQDLSGIYTDEEMEQADARAEAEAATEQQPRESSRRPVRAAATRVVDGEVAQGQPAQGEPVSTEGPRGDAAAPQRTDADWLQAIGDAHELDRCQQLWRVANASDELGRDIEYPEGTVLSVEDRLVARVEAIRTAMGQGTAAAASEPQAAAPAQGEAPTASPPTTAASGAPSGAQGGPVDWEALPDQNMTRAREMVYASLRTLYGSEEAAEAACEQEHGRPMRKVLTAQLGAWHARESKGGAA